MAREEWRDCRGGSSQDLSSLSLLGGILEMELRRQKDSLGSIFNGESKNEQLLESLAMEEKKTLLLGSITDVYRVINCCCCC